jgi:hypothetical protein
MIDRERAMQDGGGPGRVPALVFLAIVLITIAALLAGYGVPVGVGAIAGLVLGAIAGAVGSLWLGRGAGRSINLGGGAWSSELTAAAPPPELVAQMRELSETLGVDLGATRSILTVLTTVEANGLAVQLVSIGVHEGRR